MNASSSLICTSLGAYEIQAFLGSGGMASVYRGLDCNLQRPLAIIVDHIRTPRPPLRPRRADLPSSAEAVVLRALAKNPADRYASATELARALEDVCPRAPGAAAGSGDVHSQATQRWASAPRPPAQSQPCLAAPPPAAIPVAAQRSRMVLPILGGLLALLPLGGVILAAHGNRAMTDRTASGTTAAPAARSCLPHLARRSAPSAAAIHRRPRRRCMRCKSSCSTAHARGRSRPICPRGAGQYRRAGPQLSAETAVLGSPEMAARMCRKGKRAGR